MVFPGQLDLSHTHRERGELLPENVLRGWGWGERTGGGWGGSSPSIASPGHMINIGKNSHLGTHLGTDEMTFR